jgi:hypothetical protein
LLLNLPTSVCDKESQQQAHQRRISQLSSLRAFISSLTGVDDSLFRSTIFKSTHHLSLCNRSSMKFSSVAAWSAAPAYGASHPANYNNTGPGGKHLNQRYNQALSSHANNTSTFFPPVTSALPGALNSNAFRQSAPTIITVSPSTPSTIVARDAKGGRNGSGNKSNNGSTGRASQTSNKGSSQSTTTASTKATSSGSRGLCEPSTFASTYGSTMQTTTMYPCTSTSTSATPIPTPSTGAAASGLQPPGMFRAVRQFPGLSGRRHTRPLHRRF